MIEAEDLIYEYPTKRALHGVGFTVKPGEVMALVGPNGAGKTTLLRLIAALERPFSGRVMIDGRDTAEAPREVHARVGYLPDFFGLYDDLSVRQCLTYAARARGVKRGAAPAAVEKAAERVGLSDRLSARASELSRGLRQRLAIGQTIVHGPSALLLDEPAAGLDPEARHSLSGLVLSLAAEGMAIIVSSHILAELEEYCSAMLIVRDGRLVGGAPVVAAEKTARARVRIRLAAPDARLAAVLRENAGLHVLSAEAAEALVEIEAGGAHAAQLLAWLVSQGLAVSAFGEEKRTLEEAYLSASQGRTP